MIKRFTTKAGILAALWTLTTICFGNDKILIKSIDLTIGETKEIQTQSAGDLLANRKGTIDLEFVPPRSWYITGLKAGFVLLKAADGTQWKIHVHKREANTKDELTPIPAWICDSRGLRCNHEERTISGTSPLPHFLHEAEKWCHENPPCLVQADLNSEYERERRIQTLEHLGPNFFFERSKDRLIYVSTPCNNTEISSNAREHVDRVAAHMHTQIIVQCTSEHTHRPFVIKAKIQAVASNILEELGFDASAQLKITNSVHGKWLSELKNSKNKRKFEIIAEPYMILRQGYEGFASSGGEFSFIAKHAREEKNSSLQWKQYGASLKTLIESYSQGVAQVKVLFSLTQPAKGSDASRLQSSSFDSTFPLLLGQPTVVGTMTIDSRSNQEGSIPLLANIPLIGPIFQGFEDEKNQTKVIVEMLLNEHPQLKP